MLSRESSSGSRSAVGRVEVHRRLSTVDRSIFRAFCFEMGECVGGGGVLREEGIVE